MEAVSALPKAFVWRRLHSLMGLWLVLFLMEHLLVNSQAALLLGDNGQGFVRMVNSIHNLPYLEAIEIFLLGVPIFVHLVWGIKYLLTSKSNAKSSDGNTPALKQYARNRAYSWQRITSWILVVLLLFHIVKFRFLEYPVSVPQEKGDVYLVKIHLDEGLYVLGPKLDMEIYTPDSIVIAEKKDTSETNLPEINPNPGGPNISNWNVGEGQKVEKVETFVQENALVNALKDFTLSKGEAVAICKDFGTASLLSVRDTFKNPIYVGIYTIFVLSACFHAFNGFWTFLITWGVVLRAAAQKAMGKFAVGLMILITFLGLLAIWGTYWLNIR